ncbi:MAG: hypothetical protein NTY38_17020, partial [Acidobacteria bacterium]|nr:hypothetical protein [Acidobacteriota bacterium]
GRITAITYAPEKVVQYAYDVRGRVTRVTDWLGGVTKFTYNAANELILAERPNGVSTATEYDSDGSPITITNGSLASIRLTRDAAGRITEADRTMPSNPAPAAATTEFTYDKAHQIATATYDQFGRLLSDGKRTFTWDLAGRLSAFTDGEQSGSFTYDARGGMITWASGSLTRSFVQNYGLRLPSIAVERRDGADFHYFVHLPDGTLLYSISAADGARRFYHFDEAGNTQMLTDDMGAVVASFGVSPFGEVVSQSGEAETPFVYQGMWSIPRIGPGLYAMRARVYDAAAARFLSPDPVQPSLLYSTSVYHYAMSNPLLFNDPTGRDLGSMFWGAVNTVGSWFGYNSDPPTPEPAWVPYQEPEPVRIVSFAPAEISITSIPVAPPLVPLNPFAAASSVNFSLSASGVKFLSNLISGNGSTLTWQQQQVVQRIIANGGGNIVANGGGNIVALGGGNLTRADLDILASVMSGNGSTFTDAGRAVIAGIVALGGGNIIANGGGNIVALGGGNFAAAFEKVTALDANGNAFAGLNAASLQDSVSRMTAANFSF